MIFLVLSIFLSALLFAIFEWINLKQIALFPTIVTNYAVCSIWGNYMVSKNENIINIAFTWEYVLMVCMGFLFIGTFFLMGKSTAVLGGSKSSVASKMSVILPIIIGFIFLKQSIVWIQIIGITIGLASVYFTSKSTKNEESSNHNWLLIVVFIGSGLVDSGLNVLSYFYSSTHIAYPYFVSTFIFTIAFIVGLTISLSSAKFRNLFTIQSVIVGLILGIVNFLSLIYVFKALNHFKTAQAYYWMVNNIGVLLVSSLISIFIFNRKLQKINYVGLGLSIIAIWLLNFS